MSKRILIIDEENISVRGIKFLIESKIKDAYYYVSRTCFAGLRELEINSYDLVILDMMLPKGDWSISIERPDNLYGIDLLENIRKEFKDLPVICYTIVQAEDIIE